MRRLTESECEPLVLDARSVLEANYLDGFQLASGDGHYDSSWLWDAAFAAEGYATYDTDKAIKIIETTLATQQSDGRLPHMHFGYDHMDPSTLRRERFVHRLAYGKEARDGKVSAITQPPVLASSMRYVAEQLPEDERRQFIKRNFKSISDYHRWWYTQRQVDESGAVAIIHPWEEGRDDDPAMMEFVHQQLSSRALKMGHTVVDKIYDIVRVDPENADIDQRISNGDASAHILLASVMSIRDGYDVDKTIKRSKNRFVYKSAFTNSILLRANNDLVWMADQIGEQAPAEVNSALEEGERTMGHFWKGNEELFFDRAFDSEGFSSGIPTISGIMPIVSGAVSPYQAKAIDKRLQPGEDFYSEYGVPSVSKGSGRFNPRRFWQGPSWRNTDLLVAEGLINEGFEETGFRIISDSVGVYYLNGAMEYSDPITGEGLGESKFSWTAAMLLKAVKILEENDKLSK